MISCILRFAGLLTILKSLNCTTLAAELCRDSESINYPGPTVSGPGATTIAGSLKKIKTPKRPVLLPNGPLETVRISLTRSLCYGSCPSYTVELLGNGTVNYVGEAYVLVKGHHSSAIPIDNIHCLLELFKKSGFWSLADKYDSQVADTPTYSVFLTIGGHIKTVTENLGSSVGMPIAVTALEDEIDRVGANTWVRGNGETLAALQKEGFDFHSEAAATLLANASFNAPEEVAVGLIERGAPVTGYASEPSRKDAFSTTLVRASRAGRIAVVQAAISHGAILDGPSNIVDAALLSAAKSGNPLVVAEILKYKPDVNAQDREGHTPLINLAESYFNNPDKSKTDAPSCTRILLDAGANPNAVDDVGDTALFQVSSSEAVQLLIRAGAEIEAKNKWGATPLLFAATDDAAAALIEAGADTTVKDQFGNTIEKKAIEGKFSKTLTLLNRQKH